MTITPNKWELDVQGYLNTCNITSATPRKQIRDFSAGVNDLGLWNSMVCWPLRSAQNAATGNTMFSLGGLGTFNATMFNNPTRGADGINTVATNAYIGSIGLTITHALLISKSGTSSINTSFNGGTFVATSISGLSNTGSSGTLDMGNSASWVATATRSFEAIFNGSTVSQDQSTALYALYKDTLGQGITLP